MSFFLRSVVAVLAMVSTFSPITRAAELIYVAMNDNTIRTYDVSSGIAATIEASMQTFGFAATTGFSDLAFDTSGNLFASSNSRDGKIYKINLDKTISQFASGMYDGHAIAFDTHGDLYVAIEYSSSAIYKINPAGVVSQFSNSQALNWPKALAFNSSGDLYAANADNGTVIKINSVGVVSQFASGLSGPFGLAFDTSGNLYVANYYIGTISKITSSGSSSLFASGLSASNGLSGPSSLAFDRSGNLYAAVYHNSTISMFNSSGTLMKSWSTGSVSPSSIAFAPTAVPEPSTYALSVIATGVMAFAVRRNKARKAS